MKPHESVRRSAGEQAAARPQQPMPTGSGQHSPRDPVLAAARGQEAPAQVHPYHAPGVACEL